MIRSDLSPLNCAVRVQLPQHSLHSCISVPQTTMFALPVVIALVIVIITFFKYRYSYWKHHNFPYIAPSIPFGNFENFLLVSKSAGVQFWNFYKHFKKTNGLHGGVFIVVERVYVPVDRELIRNILNKDFQHFTDKNFYTNEPISLHLFALGGERWKVLRQKLTPTFTSGKMRMMLDTLLVCKEPLDKILLRLSNNKEELDIKEIAARFSTDVIGSVAFGINCNSLENPDAEFRKYGKEIFSVSKRKALKVFFAFSFKDIARKLGVLQFTKETADFFEKAVKETVNYRLNKGIERNDFMQLLINLKEKGHVDGIEHGDKQNITMDEIVAQSFVFFLAGFETSSTTVSFCMFELSQHQQIQDRVRNEINRVLVKYNGKITYESLKEMVYMKQVIDETLRKYPPLPTVDRKCVKDYKIPGTDCVLEAGVGVVISTLGLHRDPDYFPDPDKFDPERFSPENVQNIQPYSYMPFGEGPRVCIGLRFGIMQTKVALITLLKDYRYTLNKKTSPNMEIGLGFTLNIKGDLLLDIEKI